MAEVSTEHVPTRVHPHQSCRVLSSPFRCACIQVCLRTILWCGWWKTRSRRCAGPRPSEAGRDRYSTQENQSAIKFQVPKAYSIYILFRRLLLVMVTDFVGGSLADERGELKLIRRSLHAIVATGRPHISWSHGDSDRVMKGILYVSYVNAFRYHSIHESSRLLNEVQSPHMGIGPRSRVSQTRNRNAHLAESEAGVPTYSHLCMECTSPRVRPPPAMPCFQ